MRSLIFKNTIYIFLIIFSSIVAKAQSSALPMLDINKITFDFGKRKYLEEKCDTIVFKNIGDTVLTIYKIDSILRPFYSNITYPHTLEKGDSLVFYICYKPYRASRDSQRVFLRADTRLSHSIALLFDVSMSMDELLPSERKTRLQAANEAGEEFILSMLNTPKVSDEAAIYSFAQSFYENQNWTSDKQLLINSLPKTTYPSTAFYDACVEAINRLKTRKYQKVLVALTDGEDNRSRTYNANDVITQARANNIKVYTVGVGSNVSDGILQNIAQSTGGQFFKAQSSSELKDIYFKIFNLLSKNVTLYFDLLGACTEPFLQLECKADSSTSPGDTLSYKIYLYAVNTDFAMNSKYKLKFRFNPRLLLPLSNSGIPYEFNGIFELNGINRVNLDSFPLATIKFLSLMGDSSCTDLQLVSLTWDDNWYPPLTTMQNCKICISTCVRHLSNVLYYEPITMMISPNPANSQSKISFRTNSAGRYSLKLYDILGNTLATIVENDLPAGIYSYEINLSQIPEGTYFLRLYGKDVNCFKRLEVLK